jgi:hypothetical protein
LQGSNVLHNIEYFTQKSGLYSIASRVVTTSPGRWDGLCNEYELNTARHKPRHTKRCDFLAPLPVALEADMMSAVGVETCAYRGSINEHICIGISRRTYRRGLHSVSSLQFNST